MPTPSIGAPEPDIGANDIGGIVTSRFGPEGGVWVIAETRELGTRYAKIVVTDEPWPLCHTGPSGRALSALGTRLWLGGFTEGRDGARRRSWILLQ